MWRRFFSVRLLEAAGGDGGEGGGERRPTPAELNAQRNSERLARIEQISRGVDGRRSTELGDVNGERDAGRFSGGEFDDTPEARERAAEDEDARAAEALREQQERAEAAELEEQQAAARAIQEEGGGDPEGARGRATTAHAQEGEDSDTRVTNGVRYYRQVVGGVEKWLTLSELREAAARSSDAERTLQAAQEALRSASQAALAPNEQPVELGDAELENVVLSAVMGDQEAVRKLVSVIRTRTPTATPQEISRQVSQQIATQRALDQAERAQEELLGNESLAPIFRMKLAQFAQASPTTKIVDAYQTVGDQMRKEFAPMLKANPQVPSKADRKRQIVNPPAAAARQATGSVEDQEPPVSSVIDQIAKGRGQERAIRQGRRS